jgi:hypothetical protein
MNYFRINAERKFSFHTYILPLCTYECKHACRSQINLGIIPWLGRQSLFQTIDEDPDFDIAEIQRVMEITCEEIDLKDYG